MAEIIVLCVGLILFLWGIISIISISAWIVGNIIWFMFSWKGIATFCLICLALFVMLSD